MTDWQAPWAVLMTQAQGQSIIHEAVFENRFGYVKELKKMGAQIKPEYMKVENPDDFYNFNLEDDAPDSFHAIQISGPSTLHNAIVSISDLRAGASLVIAALAASGETTIHGVHLINRGYENFSERLTNLGAEVRSISEG
jgi:UDP-N-acetylglucosamine 1-carboxyvinyltransferase